MTRIPLVILASLVLLKDNAFSWAFTTPVERNSAGVRIGRLQDPRFRLAMAPKMSKFSDDTDDIVSVEVSPKIITKEEDEKNSMTVLVAATSTTIMGLTVMSEIAEAISVPSVDIPSVSIPSVSIPPVSIPSVSVPKITMPEGLTQSFDPSSFTPVCSASDSFYRVLQATAQGVVGKDNFVEYGPLIASGLLRVRLELCVVESFFNEAVGPFIQQNGLSWVLPLHETVETFLAGSVFALATTFILVGSTKLLTVIFTYADFFVGGPLRLFGGFFFDRARGVPVILEIGFGPFKTRIIGPKDTEESDNNKTKGKLDYAVNFSERNPAEIPVIILSGGVKFAGQSIGLFRELLDAIDLFVGKSLVLWATAYIGIKFLHFKVFPDFP